MIKPKKKLNDIINNKHDEEGYSKIYKLNGDIMNINERYNGKNIFKKMTNSNSEIQICKILMNNPNKHIVNIYEIGNNYINMEILNNNLSNINKKKIIEKMRDVKTYLQKKGIIYIDWHIDNIGININGTLKLFDFDVSGLINLDNNEWIIKPLKYYYYNKAINNNIKIPTEIDDYAFSLFNKLYNNYD